MEETKELITTDDIRSKVYIIRGQQVMLDKDLAEIYGYEVKKLNQQVKRNIEKFDDDFMFTLTDDEYENLRSQNVTSKQQTPRQKKIRTHWRFARIEDVAPRPATSHLTAPPRRNCC